MLEATFRRWLFALLVISISCNWQCFNPDESSFSSSIYVVAQEKPAFATPQYSNISHRTDVCDYFLLWANGSRDIRDLLEGVELRVGIVDHRMNRFLKLNGTGENRSEYSIDEENPGIFVQILDELARRAKFTWRNSYGLIDPPNTLNFNWETKNNYTWTDVLLDSVQRYDLSMADWVHNQERRRLGISFPAGWFDASTIIVQKHIDSVVLGLDLDSFLRPFSREVWYLITAVIFFSGVIFWAIEKIEFPNDKIDTVVTDTFLATLALTQHHTYWDPIKSHTKRIFGLSSAFWSLVLTAAYTANLAKFLVAEQNPVVLAAGFGEVTAKGLTVCARAGAAVFSQINASYPDIKFQTQDDFSGVYKDLRDGKCDVMAGRVADFDVFVNDKNKNPDCNLDWVGRPDFINRGGAGTLVDTSNYCTSIIRHVLDVHMHEMIADGTAEYMWMRHLKYIENYTLCTASEDSLDVEGEYALKMLDVGGVFVFHVSMMFIAIIVTLIESPWRRKRHRKKKARAEREAAMGKLGASLEKPRHSMERLSSSMGYVENPYRRNSDSHRSSGHSYNDYNDHSYNDDLSDSFRTVEGGDPVVRAIEAMKAKLNRMERHVLAKRKSGRGESLSLSPRKPASAKAKISQLPVIEDDEDMFRSNHESVPFEEADLSSGGNPNEGKQE